MCLLSHYYHTLFMILSVILNTHLTVGISTLVEGGTLTSAVSAVPPQNSLLRLCIYYNRNCGSPPHTDAPHTDAGAGQAGGSPPRTDVGAGQAGGSPAFDA